MPQKLPEPKTPHNKAAIQREPDLKENIGLIDEKLVILFANVFCRLSSYALTYPFLRFHIQSQVPVPYSEYQFSSLFSNISDFVYLAKSEGIQLLWRGCPSYIIVAEATNLLFQYTDGFIGRLVGKSIFVNPAVLFSECVGTLLLSPFYTSVLIDSVLSLSVTGPRSILFFISLGLDRIIGTKRRFQRNTTAFINPQFPSLFHIATGLIFQLLTKKAIISIMNLMFYFYDKIKGKPCEKSLAINATKTLNKDLISWAISETLALPLTVSTIKLCLQGYEVIIDTVNRSSKYVIETSSAAPTFYRSFFDCLLSTYEDYGILGYFSGFGYLLSAVFIKYGIVYFITKVLNFYDRKHHKVA